MLQLEMAGDDPDDLGVVREDLAQELGAGDAVVVEPPCAGCVRDVVHEHDRRRLGAERQGAIEPLGALGGDEAAVVAGVGCVESDESYGMVVDDVVERAGGIGEVDGTTVERGERCPQLGGVVVVAGDR